MTASRFKGASPSKVNGGWPGSTAAPLFSGGRPFILLRFISLTESTGDDARIF
jgi:hypothetical protein